MQRLRNLSQIARRLPPHPTLVLHSACSEPLWLASQLAAEADAFDGARVYCLMPMGDAPYAEPPASKHLQVTTFFPGKGLRAAVTEGRAKSLREPLSAIPGLFERDQLQADALFLQVSPPDAQGHTSLGLAVDYIRAVLRQKPLVVAQINPCLPRTCGDTRLHVSDIDYFIESSFGPQLVAPMAGDETDRSIAMHLAGLIEDGAVLQVGIGSLPDLVLGRLHDRRNLGIHTGVITDAALPLLQAGVVNNSTKQRFHGISITTMAIGTRLLYDFLDDNSAVEFHPCSLTHDADVLASIEGLTAVNSALQVDLAGRVNAEAVAGRIVAAPGGLPDFARGARRALRGRSIIALRSCFGERSNIVTRLPADAPVTVDGEAIDHVVTEFGIASLRGLGAVQRAEALIGVAHPDHRAALQRDLAQ